jgi:hypothetical protein
VENLWLFVGSLEEFKSFAKISGKGEKEEEVLTVAEVEKVRGEEA